MIKFSLLRLPFGFAEILHAADFTFWAARRTDGTAVQDESVAKIVRFFGRQNFSELLFYFQRVLALAQTKPSADADAVRVRYDGGLVVDVADNEIRRFAPDTRQRRQNFYRVRYNTVEIRFQFSAHGENVARFCFVKPAGMNESLNFLLRARTESVKIGKTGKQPWGDQVDPCVGTLSRKPGSNQKLERVAVNQRANRAGIFFFQGLHRK